MIVNVFIKVIKVSLKKIKLSTNDQWNIKKLQIVISLQNKPLFLWQLHEMIETKGSTKMKQDTRLRPGHFAPSNIVKDAF